MDRPSAIQVLHRECRDPEGRGEEKEAVARLQLSRSLRVFLFGLLGK